ncbi:hypothetical protein F116p65 [Pseudomonas phage F116]|uniref:Uncharacterized protein n=2 Tax=Hollowayvirus TaxID=1720324 RepID=Q5QF64_9CAUD|nr:hypothetical protein QGM58_gp63 [Pseudomonas phage LKA5]YP_164329.1 hypothetical protein F116p65 [Pseudomonas phage F116]AAT47254.1 unknown [Pseudomonas phage F116]AGR46415.1 hypothetical protein LKA5_065 [Pseudomonas phage LKA5]
MADAGTLDTYGASTKGSWSCSTSRVSIEQRPHLPCSLCCLSLQPRQLRYTDASMPLERSHFRIKAARTVTRPRPLMSPPRTPSTAPSTAASNCRNEAGAALLAFGSPSSAVRSPLPGRGKLIAGSGKSCRRRRLGQHLA